MNSPLTILGIAGSLRQDSYNRLALQAAQKFVSSGWAVSKHPFSRQPAC